MNKKIIFVILLFIGVSFIVYSFANPLTSDDQKMKDDDQYNENLNDDDDDDTFEDLNGDIVDDDSDEKEDENSESDESQELTDSSNQDTTQVYGTGNSYYSSSRRPNNSGSSSGGSSIVYPGTGGNGSSSGNNSSSGGSGFNPGNSGGGSTGGSSGGNDNQGTVTPPQPLPTESVFQINTPVGDGTNGAKVTISKNGHRIVLSGTMMKQPMVNGVKTGSYVVLQIVAPRAFTDAELSKMSVFRKEYNSLLTQAQHKIIAGNTGGKPYFELTQEFMTGDAFTLVIDWGDGKAIEYVVECNIKVI